MVFSRSLSILRRDNKWIKALILKPKKSDSGDLRKSHRALLDENASLLRKLEKIEANSSAREDRVKSLASQIKIGFWEWDEVEDCAAFYSEEMANIFGVTLEDLYDRFKTQKKFTSCIHPDDIQHYLNSMDLTICISRSSDTCLNIPSSWIIAS